MSKLHELLRKQRQGMVFNPYYVTPEQRANMQHIAQCTREGVMRGPEFTYNPEHPYMQRVPVVHAQPLDAESMQRAFIACLMHAFNAATSTYPSMKGH